MNLINDYQNRLKNIITGTCNTTGCDGCGLKWDGGCSATDLEGKIMDLEMEEMNKPEPTQAAKHSKAFYAQLKADGKRIVEFNCPYCFGINETQSNHSQVDWEGLNECVHCSSTMIKTSHAYHGPITTKKLD
ncbi:conserved hypothetical protein [Vibrio chagasii]|nr:conserved hypothetical protein [Vibrio chagasii]